MKAEESLNIWKCAERAIEFVAVMDGEALSVQIQWAELWNCFGLPTCS